MSRPGYVRIAHDIGASEEALAIRDDHYLAAIGLFVLALGYCSRQLTDGRIPERAFARAIAPGVRYEKPLTELEQVGLIERDAAGWYIPGYLKWQRSRQDVEAASAKASKASAARWSKADSNPSSNPSGNAKCIPNRNAPIYLEEIDKKDLKISCPNPDGSDPHDDPVDNVSEVRDGVPEVADPDPPELLEGEIVSGNGSALDGFDAFWDAYPRREAKVKAENAWRRVPKTCRPLAVGVATAMARLVDAGRQERRFVPLPATFLNGRRWEDWREGFPAGWTSPGEDRAAALGASIDAALAEIAGGDL